MQTVFIPNCMDLYNRDLNGSITVCLTQNGNDKNYFTEGQKGVVNQNRDLVVNLNREWMVNIPAFSTLCRHCEYEHDTCSE